MNNKRLLGCLTAFFGGLIFSISFVLCCSVFSVKARAGVFPEQLEIDREAGVLTPTLYLSSIIRQGLPDSRILFSDGNTHFYAINPDGSGLTMITHDNSPRYWPVASPDGKKIAFIKEFPDYQHTEIMVMNSDGSNEVRLTDNAYQDSQPDWSPDSQKIAFISSREDGKAKVYSMNLDGSNQTKISDGATNDSGPAWSPLGDEIAYIGNGDIYTIQANGTGKTQITDFTNPSMELDWSPDGSKIVFSAYLNGDYTDLYVISADGSNLIRLTSSSGGESEPIWSPDGLKIAFVANPIDRPQVFIMDPDGMFQVKITAETTMWLRGISWMKNLSP